MQVVCDEETLSSVNKKLKGYTSFHPNTPQSSEVLGLNTPRDKGNAFSIIVFKYHTLDMHFELKYYFSFLHTLKMTRTRCKAWV